MLTNYLKIAIRNLMRKKLYSFINIAGLAIGLSLFILIGLWVRDELSFDRFHEKKDRIYMVSNQVESGQRYSSPTYALAPFLKHKYAEVEQFARVWPWNGSLVKYGEKSFQEDRFYLTDPGFFRMFTFPFLRGDPEKALSDKYDIVITRETADRYFGSDDPIGKTLFVARHGRDFRVTGVIADIPVNSYLQFDLIGRVELLGQERLERWQEWVGPCFIELKPGVSAEGFEDKIAGTYLEQLNPNVTYVPVLEPLDRVYLNYQEGPGKIKKIYIFSFIAAFILLMACVNFMNLSTARSQRRVKEVSMRQVMGANRGQLMRQFMGEALLTALFSLILALITVQALLPLFNRFTGKELTFLQFDQLWMIPLLLLITILTGLLAGSYPALLISSFRPLDVLRIHKGSAKRGITFRRILIVFQFSISICLIACTLTVSRQMQFIQKRDLGLDRSQVVYMFNNPSLLPRFETFKNQLLQSAAIKEVTSAAQLPTQVGQSVNISWDSAEGRKNQSMDYTVVDYDFFKTLGINIVRGRVFSTGNSSDEREACLINETAARIMGFEDPIGKVIAMNHPAWADDFKNARIIGVVNNFHSRSLHSTIQPFVFRMYKPWYAYVLIKLDGSRLQDGLNHIKQEFSQFSPDYPFRYQFLDDFFDSQYISERRTGILFNGFGLLSIFIACLGLFGLACHSTEQRTKEIGIRKVLGASVAGIVSLTSREFIRWIFLANLFAWPLAYLVMKRWLQDFAYRAAFSPIVFFLSAALVLIIALLTVSYHSIRSARANPVDSLRYE